VQESNITAKKDWHSCRRSDEGLFHAYLVQPINWSSEKRARRLDAMTCMTSTNQWTTEENVPIPLRSPNFRRITTLRLHSESNEEQ